MAPEVDERFWLLERIRPTRLSRMLFSAEGMATVPIDCPLDWGHARGRRIGSLVVKGTSEVREDFAWTARSEILCSPQVRRAFADADVSGCEWRPAEIRVKSRKAKHIVTDYAELRAVGWGGFVSPKSGPVLMKNCPGCGHLEYRIIDPDRMADGITPTHDIFFLWPLVGYVFVTRKVIEIIERLRLTGVQFLPPQKAELMPWNVVFPGRLSWVLPDDQARSIGIPLGIY